MKESRKHGRLVLATTLIAVCAASLYYSYLKIGIFSTMLLAVFSTVPLSLVIPITAIRFGILGAWIGAFVGYIPHDFISLLFMDRAEVLNKIGPWLLPAFSGGAAIIGAAAGVLLALRKNSTRK